MKKDKVSANRQQWNHTLLLHFGIYLLTPDEGSCNAFSTRNNCCEFLAFHSVTFQSVIKSILIEKWKTSFDAFLHELPCFIMSFFFVEKIISKVLGYSIPTLFFKIGLFREIKLLPSFQGWRREGQIDNLYEMMNAEKC